MTTAPDNPFRPLPAVDALLQDERVVAAAEGLPAADPKRLAGRLLAEVRGRIQAGDLGADEVSAWGRTAAAELAAELRREHRRGLRPVLNATGVVLNTGLGRAPVHLEAAAVMERAARSFCVLEVDRFSGRRNERDARLGELAARLAGAEAGIAVNNCAAAVLLTLSTFGWNKRVVVSRGELVEIGGSFRMPSVMERAGAKLVEVGTTNRTRIADYEQALAPDVGLLLKVHTSNYRVVGFTEEVQPADLAALGRRAGVPTAFDLGSGRVEPSGASSLDFLGDEPDLGAAVRSGVDLVMFSGDKLLGGPQCGLIVGTEQHVATLRKNPLYRALRLDKVALAGLERTLELQLAGRADEIPARAMLLADTEQLRARAALIARALDALDGFEAQPIASTSQPGSGSAPDVFLETTAVRVVARGRTAERLAADLRAGEPAVFARIKDDVVLLDPRTLLDGEDALLIQAFEVLEPSA